MKLFLSLCWAVTGLQAQSAFYSLAATDLTQRANGDLLRSESINGAPEGATAYRVLYRSEGPNGEPIAVSGVVFIPAAPAPSEGRAIIAWAHPTTGLEPKCAPSKAHVLFQSIPGLHQMLQRGFIVTATDYPGLGTPGSHPFLVGSSEARAVLDSVRVAQRVPDAKAGKRFAVWGHSQGGHAALFTGLLVETYAPELQLVGVAAAAPATDLDALLAADLDTNGGRNLTAMTLWSWSRFYDAPLPTGISPEGIAAMDRLAGGCIETILDFIKRRGPTRDIAQNFSVPAGFSSNPPWNALLAENTPGLLPASIPLLLAQGEKDGLVLPRITRDYQARQCAIGSAVQFFSMPKAGHAFAGRDSAKTAIEWTADRFAGAPPPNNCPAQ